MAKQVKRAQPAAKPPTTDVFTRLCAKELQVVCTKEHFFHPKRKWRFDYAILEHKIAIEVEGGVWTGGRHTTGEGFMGDIEKYNTATLLGWRVFRVVPDTLLTLATLNLLRTAILGHYPPGVEIP